MRTFAGRRRRHDRLLGKKPPAATRGENTKQEAEYNRYTLLEEKSPSTEIRHP